MEELCEHCNCSPRSLQRQDYSDQLSEYQLFKEDLTLRSYAEVSRTTNSAKCICSLQWDQYFHI